MSVYQRVTELEAKGEVFALCMIVKTTGSTPRREGSKMLVFEDGHAEGTIGGGEMESRVVKEALEAIKAGKPRLVTYSLSEPARGDPGVCGGQMEVYVEPNLPQPTVVVVGAGHVGKAVAELAHWLGYQVVVCDDRLDFATPENIPDAGQYFQVKLSELPGKVNIHRQTYLVLTTRNVDVDVEGLPELLDTPAAYLGIIGSKRRWETTRKQLLEKGISKKQLDKVVSPMGLDISAETPEEIAVSILAEILMLRGSADGKRMKA